MKKVLVVLAVVCLGIIAGYYSGPVYNWLFSKGDPTAVSSSRDESGPKDRQPENSSSQFISKDEAIKAVKNFGPVRAVIDDAEKSGFRLDFTADQEPTAEFPVWVVEIKEIHPDKVPESRYFQVEAVTGRILDLTAEELAIDGVGFAMSRAEVTKIMGKPQRFKRQYDEIRQQTVRIDTYRGMEIVYSSGDRVIKMTVSDTEHQGPRGLRKGLAREAVLTMFGKPVTVMTDLMEYRPVDDDKSWFVVNLDGNGSVSGFSMEKAL